MSVVTPLLSIEIENFNHYLCSLDILNSCNYSVRFTVESFNIEGVKLPIKEVLQMAYPNSKLDSAHVIISNMDELWADLNDCVCYQDEYCSEAKNLFYGFRNWLNECIEFDDALIYKYNSWQGLPGSACWWYFLWLIHNPREKKCVLLYGYASD